MLSFKPSCGLFLPLLVVCARFLQNFVYGPFYFYSLLIPQNSCWLVAFLAAFKYTHMHATHMHTHRHSVCKARRWLAVSHLDTVSPPQLSAGMSTWNKELWMGQKPNVQTAESYRDLRLDLARETITICRLLAIGPSALIFCPTLLKYWKESKWATLPESLLDNEENNFPLIPGAHQQNLILKTMSVLSQ